MTAINAVILPLSLIIDRLIGDPRSRFHPVALIGSFIGWWGRPAVWTCQIQRAAGVVMWLVTVILFALPFFLVPGYFPGIFLLFPGLFSLNPVLPGDRLRSILLGQ